ncbi:MAG: ANTAR domain-containing protein [Deltaproteobacteria bacterium]|nr:ANTAR domain-containing protein [Deltaproteobacteria bacterium]
MKPGADTEELETLRKEVAELKGSLEARKIIERAKGILMEKDALTENEAYKRLRTISMDKRISMKEMAELILLAHGRAG